ncbi:hypothetical protein [Parabacteroides bouchesdurhonensis]|uniref:hypothetical protein n=1 Tax=Parabacteroides bouchesdurhonensis TaxID=1936995 RepID=UPI000C85ADC5|nr:hypothetical protein [Parabacteroides bouchesdurhonensis]
MNIEDVLKKEVCNDDHIHLYYCAVKKCWKAYEQSAINLLELIPDLNIQDEIFEDHHIRLRCALITKEQIECYKLSHALTLLSEEYVELQLNKSLMKEALY